MHGISAAADTAARKLDRDEVLVMTVHRGEVYLLTGDGQWTGTGSNTPAQEKQRSIRSGDDFATYYVVADDGSHTTI